MNNWILFAVLMTLMACQSEEEKVESIIVTGLIQNPPSSQLTISLPHNIHQENISIDTTTGEFYGEVPVLNEGYLDIYMARQGATFYASPGDSIHLAFDYNEFDESITFSGDGAKENNFIHQRSLYQDEYEMKMRELYSLPYDDFKDSLVVEQQGLSSFIDNNSEGLDPQFLKIERSNLTLNSKMRHANYDTYSGYFNKDAQSDSAAIKAGLAILRSIDINDPQLLQNPSANQIITNLLSNLPVEVDYQADGPESYFNTIWERAKAISNPMVKEYALYDKLTSKINYGGGLDNITTEIDDFRSLVSTDLYIDKVDSLIYKWQPLKRGNPAPVFVGDHLDDTDFSSLDLKGKNIYVDVWATWCGPCIREIPHLKEIEHDYEEHDDLVFLSVSIDDDQSIATWKEFVDKKELGGIQVHAPAAWQSDIVKGYNIQGIPRFLLIDSEGKIVSADAPRPSHQSLRGMLDAMLEKS